MHLRDLLVFGTTGEVVQCKKFLISRVHKKNLLLDQRYLIHVDDIHHLTRLSLEGEDLSKGFQGSSKHEKKKGKVSLYEKFHTQRGRRTAKIDPIIPNTVWKSCYVIVRKVMRSYY